MKRLVDTVSKLYEQHGEFTYVGHCPRCGAFPLAVYKGRCRRCWEADPDYVFYRMLRLIYERLTEGSIKAAREGAPVPLDLRSLIGADAARRVRRARTERRPGARVCEFPWEGPRVGGKGRP